MRRRAEIAHAAATSAMNAMRAAFAAARETLDTAENLTIPDAERLPIVQAARRQFEAAQAALDAAIRLVDGAGDCRALVERSEISRLGVPILR